MGSKKKIILTLLSSVSVQLCNILISLLVPRIIISVYGSDTNGIVAAARQFSQYLALMETSITAVTCYKFIEFKKKNEYEKINNLFVTIGEFYKKVGIIIGIIAVVIAVFYATTSKTDVNAWIIILLFFLYESIYVISYQIYYKYNFILFANGKQYFIAFGTVISTLSAAALKCFIAIQHWHILILIGAGVCVDIIRLEIIRHKVVRDYPYLDKKKAVIDNSLLDQKWDSLVMSISDSLKSMIPILCISIGYGSALVSVFSIYQTVMHLGTSIITMCANGLLPVLGMKFTDGDERASNNFRTVTIVVFSLATVISICFCGMILNFINLYIGSGADISYVYPTLAMLLIFNTWLTMARAPFDLLIKAFGRIRELRDGCLVEICITIVVCILMSLLGRFELIVIGVAISSAYRVLRMLVFSVRKLGIGKLSIMLRDFIVWFAFSVVFGLVFYKLIPLTSGITAFIKYAIIELLASIAIVFIVLSILYKKIIISGMKMVKRHRP